MGQPERYRDFLVERLRSLLESRGTSVLRVEKLLGRGRGYVADALRGHKKLTIEVILDVLGVLDVEPEEFFGRPAPIGGERGESLRGGQRPASTPEPGASPLLQAVMLLLAHKGLREGDLQEIQRELEERLGRAREAVASRPRTAKR